MGLRAHKWTQCPAVWRLAAIATAVPQAPAPRTNIFIDGYYTGAKGYCSKSPAPCDCALMAYHVVVIEQRTLLLLFNDALVLHSLKSLALTAMVLPPLLSEYCLRNACDVGIGRAHRELNPLCSNSSRRSLGRLLAEKLQRGSTDHRLYGACADRPA